jgi:hypothetical protein
LAVTAHFYLVIQVVRTSLCRFSRPTHHKSGQWSPAPTDRNFVPGERLLFSPYVVAERHRETT